MKFAEIVKEKSDEDLLEYVKSESFIQYVDSLSVALEEFKDDCDKFREQARLNNERIQKEFADIALLKNRFSATQRGGEDTE